NYTLYSVKPLRYSFSLNIISSILDLHRVYYRHSHNWNFSFSFLLRGVSLFLNKFRLSFAYLFHIIEIFFASNSLFIFNEINYADEGDNQILRFEMLFIFYGIGVTHAANFAQDI